MEAASRKRCTIVALMTLAVLLVVLWIHGEAVSVKLLGTTRNYNKNESVELANQQLRTRHNNETASTSNTSAPHVSAAVHVANETTTTEAPSTVSKNESINDAHILHNTTRNATIVVFLSGEMGNHLSILAKAWSVRLLAQKQYGIFAELVLRHQSHPKWIYGRDAIQKCFPKLREYNFSAANTNAFEELAREQERLLVKGKWDPARLKLDSDQDDKNTLNDSLLYWKSILDSPSLASIETDAAAGISFPFLSVASWCPLDMLDQYLEQIRSFFEFDKKVCCRIQPDPDESVFVSTVCSLLPYF